MKTSHDHNPRNAEGRDSRSGRLLPQLLNGPLLLTERAPVVLLDPEAHAAMVEAVVALAPYDNAILKRYHLFCCKYVLVLQVYFFIRLQVLLSVLGDNWLNTNDYVLHK